VILYSVSDTAPTDVEGEDNSEWFTAKWRALAHARKRLKGLQAEGFDQFYVTVDRVELLDLPRKALAIQILNRRGYVQSTVEVCRFNTWGKE